MHSLYLGAGKERQGGWCLPSMASRQPCAGCCREYLVSTSLIFLEFLQEGGDAQGLQRVPGIITNAEL